jgi:pimeloyl-ACP methyl ester carboxylesterase
MLWKFDNYVRSLTPYGHNIDKVAEIFGQITCPVLLFWGKESRVKEPLADPWVQAIRDVRSVGVAKAGQWVHHDQLPVFLDQAKRFLNQGEANAPARQD